MNANDEFRFFFYHFYFSNNKRNYNDASTNVTTYTKENNVALFNGIIIPNHIYRNWNQE